MILPRRILHVDDDPQFTELIAGYLKDYGYETKPIHDSCMVMQQLPKYQERVVLLDIDMPGLNGMDLLKRIKAFDGGIQIVMLTGLVTMNTVLQSLRWGAEACFFKPVSDIEPVVNGLEGCFRKIEQWWGTLEELTHRRKTESESAAATAESLLAQAAL